MEKKAKEEPTAVKKTAKKRKANQPPPRPEFPPSGFFLFMLEFRDSHKKGEKFDVVAGLEQWKAMPDSEKAPYRAKADKEIAIYEKKFAEYEKRLEAYERRNSH